MKGKIREMDSAGTSKRAEGLDVKILSKSFNKNIMRGKFSFFFFPSFSANEKLLKAMARRFLLHTEISPSKTYSPERGESVGY